jgi:hypothetical protein
MSRRLERTALVIGAAVGACGLWLSAGQADAASTNNLWEICNDCPPSADTIFNYDFNSNNATSTNVDWPVTLIFYNNATINRVKSDTDLWTDPNNDFGFSSAEMKHMRQNIGAGNVWDADGGKKQPLCPTLGVSSPHYRIYAIGANERLFNRQWGFWVPGTTHRDWNECPPIKKRHGYSEGVEELLLRDVADNTTVISDSVFMLNDEPLRKEGNHTWLNNAFASQVRIP